MTTEKASSRQGLLSTLFRRGRPEVEVAGYQEGDIREEVPVCVLADAALAGNLSAPEVVIAGLVYGQIVARYCRIEEGGQVWGNVHVQSLEMAAGGMVHGWVHTIDEEAYAQLWADVGPPAPPEESERALPEELLPAAAAGGEPPAPEREPAMHLLQQEAGAALAARRELEHAFEERVDEVAGDARNRVQELEAARRQARQERAAMEIQLADRGQMVEKLSRRVDAQKEELERLRGLLETRATGLQEAKTRLEEVSERKAQAEEHARSLESRLNESLNRADELAGRVESLESALQASVRHAAEQEEALIHWQELAEVTQGRVTELEEELDAAQQTIENGQQIITQLRARQEKVETMWGEAHEEAETLRAALEEHPATAEGVRQALEEADDKIARLESALMEAEERAAELHSQSLWYEASLKATGTSVRQIRKRLAEQEETVQLFKGEADESRSLAEQWKENVGRLSELLYESELRVKEKESDLEALRAALKEARAEATRAGAPTVEEVKSLQETISQRDIRIDALEQEVERYHKEINSQRERLAEARAELAEGHVALQEMKERLEQRTREAKKIRYLAADRIHKLEKEVASSRRRLKALAAAGASSPAEGE